MVKSDNKEYDFKEIEEKWQKKWEKDGIFEPEVDKENEKLFFTTPYPYISGSLHIGHGRAVVESDVYSRYKRMKGLNVLYPMAFHVSGTPVLGISSSIKNKDKKTIDLYKGYVSAYVKDKEKVKKTVNSFTDPKKIVDFFIPKMIEEYKTLGLGIDWSRSFTSADIEHQQMVTWQFEKYKEKGYLTKEKYPVLYSPEDESAMGEDDIKEGDINPVEKMEFTLLKFKFKDKFLIAATLRPETVFGQTNLWINPEVKYIEAQVGKETWILSKEAVKKIEYQRKDIKEKGYTKEKLVGEYVIAPVINRKLIILPSKFVDPDIGTGIVISVPSDAPYDYVALKNLQDMKELDKRKNYGFTLEQIEDIEEIEVIPIIETERYGDKAGVKAVEEAQIILIDDPKLEKLTQEVYKEGYHNGVMLKICGKYSGMKVIEAKDKIKQEMIKKNEANVMYETSHKAFSRSGGKIIVAVLDDQWFLDFNAKGWKEEASRCLEKMELIPPTMKKQFEDTFSWLDKRPCARKRGLGTLLPFDKNWVIESLSDSTIYMTLYTINHLIRKYKLKRENLSYEFFEYVYLGKGKLEEISKKTSVKKEFLKEMRDNFEYWMPVDHRHTFVLHLSNHLSFMIFAFAGLFEEKYWPKKISFHGLVLSEKEKMSKSKGNVVTLLDVKEKYGADVFRFYMTYSTNLMGAFDWKEQEAQNAKSTAERVYFAIEEAVKNSKKEDFDDYYKHKFEKIKKQASEMIEIMKLREYNMVVIYDLLSLVGKAKLSLGKKELAAFYEYILADWIKLISLVMPHIAEELWYKKGNKGFVSTQKWVIVDESRIIEQFDKIEDTVEKVVSDIQNILKILKEKSGIEGKKVYIYAIPSEVDFFDSKFLKMKVGKEVVVYAANGKNVYDPTGKRYKSRLGKPSIYIE